MKGISAALAIPVILLVLLGAGAVASGTFGPINQILGSINQTGYDARQNALSQGALSDTEDGSVPAQDNDQGQGSEDVIQQPVFDSAPDVAVTGQDVTFSASATASEEVLTQATFFMNSKPAGLNKERSSTCGESTQSAVSACSGSETVSLKDITEGTTKGYELGVETRFETDSDGPVQLQTEEVKTDTEVVEITFDEVPESVEGGSDVDVDATAAAAENARILNSAELSWDASSVSSPSEPVSTTSCTTQQQPTGNVGSTESGSQSCDIQHPLSLPSGDYQAVVEVSFATTLGPVEDTAVIEVNPGSGLAVTVLNNGETPVEEAEVSILEQTKTTGPDGVAQFSEIGGEVTEIKVNCDGNKRTFSYDDDPLNPEQALEEQVELLGDETLC